MKEKVKLTNLDKMQHSTQQKYIILLSKERVFFFYISQSDYVEL